MDDEKEKKQAKSRLNYGRPLPPKESRWSKGKSGNVDGRPKGVRNRSTIPKQILTMMTVPPEKILKVLQIMFPEMEKRMTAEEVSYHVQLLKAITKGDTQAHNSVVESAYGKPNQSISGPDGKDIGFNVTVNPYAGMTLEELRALKAKRKNAK